ncbi:conserved Plasmodium protein, unknown function [Plasmodium ovale wallikeri]|uniref:Uncharacterized protein n=2 Tax=Plasmodium ovale TaxID=36330 RepID=A0A1A8YI12_PLAOA|nr:conserved Plasmodium protein, unknown function [Plasmodium ovale wallikeri]SBT31781.1 conserved Plasmodium protein, unknown function [Plasmodium ovale wallikeri]SBT75484.1 conserved Plasmodium protein, unknown function [Plasmodium ovale]
MNTCGKINEKIDLFLDENERNNIIHCDIVRSMSDRGKDKLRKLLKWKDNFIYDDMVHLNIYIKNIWISMNLKCKFSLYDLILISRSFKNTEIIYDDFIFNDNIKDSLFKEEKKKKYIFLYFNNYKIRKNVVKIFFPKPYIVCFIHKNGSIHIHGSLTLRKMILLLIKIVKKLKYKTFWNYLCLNSDNVEHKERGEPYSKVLKNPLQALQHNQSTHNTSSICSDDNLHLEAEDRESQGEGSQNGEDQGEGSQNGEDQGKGSQNGESQGEGSQNGECQGEGSQNGEYQGEGSQNGENQGEESEPYRNDLTQYPQGHPRDILSMPRSIDNDIDEYNKVSQSLSDYSLGDKINYGDDDEEAEKGSGEDSPQSSQFSGDLSEFIRDSSTDNSNISSISMESNMACNEELTFCENVMEKLEDKFKKYEIDYCDKDIPLQEKETNSKEKRKMLFNDCNNDMVKKCNLDVVKKETNERKEIIQNGNKEFITKNDQLESAQNGSKQLGKDVNDTLNVIYADEKHEIPQLNYDHDDDVNANGINQKDSSRSCKDYIMQELDSHYEHIDFSIDQRMEKRCIDYSAKCYKKGNAHLHDNNELFTEMERTELTAQSHNYEEQSYLGENNSGQFSKKFIYKFDTYQKWKYITRNDITFDMNYFYIKQFVCVFKVKLKYFDITRIYNYDEFKNILTDINNIVYIKIDKNLLNKLIAQSNLENFVKHNSIKNYIQNDQQSVRSVLLFSSGNVIVYACKNKREVLCISRFIINVLKRNNNIIL